MTRRAPATRGQDDWTGPGPTRRAGRSGGGGAGTGAVVQPGRAARLDRILERDGARCVWCGRDLRQPLVRPTTEHLVPRVKGGPSWLENEVAACQRCNGQRGHATPADWLDECERRGWSPDRQAVVAALRRLEAAIVERGGQRRARPYLASQLRRLDRR